MEIYQIICGLLALIFSASAITFSYRKKVAVPKNTWTLAKEYTPGYFIEPKVNKTKPKKLSDDELIGYLSKHYILIDSAYQRYAEQQLRIFHSRREGYPYESLFTSPTKEEFLKPIIQKIRKLQKDGLL